MPFKSILVCGSCGEPLKRYGFIVYDDRHDDIVRVAELAGWKRRDCRHDEEWDCRECARIKKSPPQLTETFDLKVDTRKRSWDTLSPTDFAIRELDRLVRKKD